MLYQENSPKPLKEQKLAIYHKRNYDPFHSKGL